MSQRKQVTMIVVVKVPAGMTAAEARREVRSLISTQSNWSADAEDVKVASVKPIPKEKPDV